LHALKIGPEGVDYRSRFVRSRDFRQSQQTGRIDAPGFACDPCRNLFRRVASMFFVDATENTNINVIKQGQHYLALTELPLAIEFDPSTLRTLWEHRYNDRLPAGATTAHPHQEGDRLINQVLQYSALPAYRFYQQKALGPRQEIGRVTVEDVSYVHSFGMSQTLLILTCCPFQVAPLKLLLRNRPFIENFSWKPETGTRFHLLPRPGQSGPDRRLKAEPFFTFHHVNSVDHEDGSLAVDLIGYDDARIIQQLQLSQLARGEGIDFGRFRRYRIAQDGRWVDRELTSQHALELPNIPPGLDTRPYRFVYGISADPESSLFYDRLIKLEVDTDRALYWQETHHFPGEPIFVADPDRHGEDHGVLLSLVLAGEQARSFLLVLDAESMQELARAYLPGPVTHGFHGFFERQP
jgi:carotenoid cleavage dioxygenase-like enzyme